MDILFYFSLKPTALQADDLVRNTNVHLLRGIIQLGKMLTKNPEADAMSPEDVFHTYVQSNKDFCVKLFLKTPFTIYIMIFY